MKYDDNVNVNVNVNDRDPYGDSDLLAQRDLTIGNFRASEKESKHKIMEKMLELRHNKEYNKHLISVYMKAKGLFDKMVEEHREQLQYLEEIYRHINNMIRENLSKPSFSKTQIITELMKDKKRIGRLLKKMRNSYEKLSNVDTTIGVTIEKMDKIIELDEIQHDDDDDTDADADADADDDADAYEGEDEEDADEDEDEEDEEYASDEEDDGEDEEDDGEEDEEYASDEDEEYASDEDEEYASDDEEDDGEDEEDEDGEDEEDDVAAVDDAEEYASDDDDDDDDDDDEGIIAIY
jgi:hypothetical protein